MHRLIRRIADHARRDCRVIGRVDHDKCTGRAVIGVTVTDQRLIQTNADLRDIVHGERLRALARLERIDVDRVVDALNLRFYGARRMLDQIRAAPVERARMQPA